MTTPRHCFRTHQGDAIVRCLVDERCQMLCEFRGLHVVSETAEGNISPAHIKRPRVGMAEASESGCMRIADARILQRRWQGIAIELRVVARARHGTNVNESAHRVAGKQSD